MILFSVLDVVSSIGVVLIMNKNQPRVGKLQKPCDCYYCMQTFITLTEKQKEKMKEYSMYLYELDENFWQ